MAPSGLCKRTSGPASSLFPFCIPFSSDADGRRPLRSCCVAFPFLLRGERARAALRNLIILRMPPPPKRAGVQCRDAAAAPCQHLKGRSERNHGFGREGGRRSTSGEPIVGINCCAPPGTRHATNERGHACAAQANIHNLGRRTRDGADACVPPEPSYVIQEVCFSATFSKFRAMSVEKRGFPLLSKKRRKPRLISCLSRYSLSLSVLLLQAQSATLTIA